MKKSICRAMIVLFTVFFPLVVSASPQSSALVDQGRALLFKNGSPTYQGMVDADKQFEAAVQADPADQQARLFHAVTQLACFVLEQGDGTEFQTFADICTAMGIPLYLDELLDAGSPFGEAPKLAGQYNPPPTMPNGDDIRNMLGSRLVAVIDLALTDLGVIDSTVHVVLTAGEIDDFTDLEIDYTDVLLLKAGLNLLKTLALIITAYDLDGLDIREILALDNAGMIGLVPGFMTQLLNTYPNLLKLADTGAADLTAAKTAFLSAYQNLQGAQQSLAAETDNQADDFFVFESIADEQEFTGLINGFSELAASLTANRPATAQYHGAVWQAAVQNGDEISHLFLGQDVLGNGTVMREQTQFWGTISGLPQAGQVSFWEITGNTVRIVLDYWGYKRMVLTGTLGTGQTVFTGTCAYQQYDGSSYVQTAISPFTASLNHQWDEDVERVDVNALFGHTGKSQLVIRNILPQFDQHSEPIAGTFPTPILNGLLPDLTTNEQMAAELELDPPYKVFTIPDAAIVLDGNPSDWPSTALVGEDHDNAFMDGWEDVQGMDMVRTYLAKDSQYLYMAMELAGDPILETGPYGPVYYKFELENGVGANWSNQFAVQAYYAPWSSRWHIELNTGDGTGSRLIMVPEGETWVATGDAFIEWKIPLSEVGELSVLGGRWICFGTWWHWWNRIYPYSDWIDTQAQLSPVYTVSGSVTVPDGYSGGSIYYYLSPYDWDINADHAVAGTYTKSDGAFTLTSVPYSAADRVLHVFWDKDGNGIRNDGDYTAAITFPVQGDATLDPIALTDRIGGRKKGWIDVSKLLNILSGKSTQDLLPDMDVNEDGRMGTQDVLPILQEAGDLR